MFARIAQATLVCLLTIAFAAPAGAQAFPNKPVKIIVGFPPGGPLDTHARVLVDQLQKHLGQTVIIDYKAGAGGSIGADMVAKSPADGYTLLMANTGTMVINQFRVSQEPVRDAARLRARGAHGAAAAGVDREPDGAGQHVARVHRIGEKITGQTQLRLGR